MVYTAFKTALLWPSHRYWGAALSIPIFLVMMGPQFLYRSNPEFLNARWFEVLSWIGCIVMGIWASFILFSIAIDIIHLFFWLFQKLSANSAHDSERREFLTESARYTVLWISTGIAGLGLIEALRGARVRKINMGYPELPSNLKGLKIAQISDLHVGPTIRRGYTQEVVDRTNRQEPDIIFVTGDLADGKIKDLREHMEPLRHLKAPLGVYFVTGNHEYYWGANELLEEVKTLGFQPLINQNKIIDINGSKVMIAGITDIVGGNFIPEHAPNIQKALTSDQKADFTILLSHRPEAYVDAEPLGVNLVLAGHTHGGQFFPFSLLVPLAHKYYRGLSFHGRMQLYVNSGTGYWGPANRFSNTSEISLITIS